MRIIKFLRGVPSAEGAFFHLTFALVMLYLVWSAAFGGFGLDDRGMWFVLSGAAVTLVVLAVAFGAVTRFAASVGECRRVFICASFAAVAAVVAGGALIGNCVGENLRPVATLELVLSVPVLFAWLTALGMPRHARRYAVGAAILWTVAVPLISSVWIWTGVDFYNALFWKAVDLRGNELGSIVRLDPFWLARFKVLDAIGYDTGLVLGGAALVGAWLASGKTFACAGRIPLKTCFSRRVRTALILLGVGYAAALTFAVGREIGYRRRCAELARRFGRPLDIATYRQWLGKGRRRDPGFWKKPLEARLSVAIIGGGLNNAGPCGELPEWVSREVRTLVESNADLPKFEALLDKGLPVNPLPEIVPGEFAASFEKEERFLMYDLANLEEWRIRFAVERRDRTALLAAMRRLDTAIDYMTATFGDKGFYLENRDDCRNLVIGSGLLNDAELQELAARLAREDAAITEIAGHVLYKKAVRILDDELRCFDHRAYYPDQLPKLKSDLRAFGAGFPALWFFFRRFSMRLMDILLAADVRAPECRNPWGDDLVEYRECRARLRAQRALIAVELEKRRTGKYPAVLKDPPTDPFTGRSMQYRVGKIKYAVRKMDENRQAETVIRTSEGVAVWSVGANGRDDGGVCAFPRYGGDPDDPGARIVRLAASP